MDSLFVNIEGFDWDVGNLEKNWLKHKVTNAEAEQVFSNQPLLVGNDTLHSQKEYRYYAYSKTNEGRKLYTVFTLRDARIRIISSRDMDKYERKIYEREKA